MEDTPQDPYGPQAQPPAAPTEPGAYDPQTHDPQAYAEQPGYAPAAPTPPGEPSPPWQQQPAWSDPAQGYEPQAAPVAPPPYGQQPYDEGHAQQVYAEQAYAEQAHAQQSYSGQAYTQQPYSEPGYTEQTAYDAQVAGGAQPYGEAAIYPGAETAVPAGHGVPEAPRAKDNRPLVIALVAVGAVVVLAGAFFLLRGGGNYSDDPAAYIPKQVDGKDVSTDNKMLEAIPQAFLGVQGASKEDFDTEVASTQGETQIPGLVMMAAKAKKGDSVLSTIVQNAEAIQRGGAKAERSEIDGVETVYITQDSQGNVFEVGIAAPRDDIALVCISFGGDREAVTKCLSAMLASGGA